MISKGLELLKNDLQGEDLQTSSLTNEMGAYQFVNSSSKDKIIEFAHDTHLIHFLFALSGEISLSATEGTEQVNLTSDIFFIYSNPYVATTLKICLPKSAKIFSLVISLKELHAIFGSSFGRDETAAKEFMENYKMERFFLEKPMNPSLSVIIYQFFSGINREAVRNIYQQGKFMEFLSLYLDSPNSVQEAGNHCPFVMDSYELKKIKEARDIIVEHMIDPPSLKSLAKLVGTNEYKLKIGFKSVFSNTVYGYLLDYRMEEARKLLTVNNTRIKEVATLVGYSNPSHFIAAYKRKYGITPKQHKKSITA